MHSIRTKLTLITLMAIIVSVLCVGIVSIYSIKKEEDRNASREMKLICDNQRKSLNDYLDSIDQSVNMLSRYATQDLDVVELVNGGVSVSAPETSSLSLREQVARRNSLNRYLHEHCAKLKTLFDSVANHTNGVVNYYYRLNPELHTNEKGFVYTRNGTSGFIRGNAVDILGYDPDDIGHVGWYYLPVNRGRPSWIDPYHNDNFDMDIVSYVTPIYKVGMLIGIIGMDIYYDTLVSQIRDIEVYDTGYACLANEEGLLVYHPTLESGIDLNVIHPGLVEAIKSRSGQSDDIALVKYQYEGIDRQAACASLDNGLNLFIIAPESEIGASWRHLISVILFAAPIILAVFALMITVVTTRIVGPLQRLAAASEQVAQGDYNQKLVCDSNDEVGTLTRSFQQLVNHLNVYISDLNSKAYKDALTGVKNKAAFEAFSTKLNAQLASSPAETMPRFAVAMLDCNELKEINDAYGHEKGDIYLRTACKAICDVFNHSPVFRIGGDEFVAVLQFGDYDTRDRLTQQFHTLSGEINARAVDPWDRLSMAMGIAAFDPKLDQDVDDVLRRADALMYEEKSMMKAQGLA